MIHEKLLDTKDNYDNIHNIDNIDNIDKVPQLQKHVLFVVGLALFCDYLLLTLCVPILPNYLHDAFDPILISLLFASKPAFQFIANPFMGHIVDKHGPIEPLLLGVFILALSTFLFAYGASLSNLHVAYIILFCARSIQGIASATTMSAGMTLLALTHEESIRGTAMGLAMIGVAFGTLLGPPLGGILSHYLGNYWVPFVMVGGVLVLDLIGQLMVLKGVRICGWKGWGDVIFIQPEQQVEFRKESTDHVYSHDRFGDVDDINPLMRSESGSILQSCCQSTLMLMLRDQHIGLVALLSIAGNSTIGMIEPLVPMYLSNQYNESVLYQGLIFACATLSYLVFTPIAGILSDHYEKRKCLCIGVLLMGSGLCLFMASDASLVVVCAALAIIGGGMSFIDTPVLPFLSELIAVKRVGSIGMVYAMNDMSLSVGFTIGPILGAFVQSSLQGSESEQFRFTALIAGIIMFSLLPWGIFRLSLPVSSQNRLLGENKRTESSHNPNAPKFAVAEFRTNSFSSEYRSRPNSKANSRRNSQ